MMMNSPERAEISLKRQYGYAIMALSVVVLAVLTVSAINTEMSLLQLTYVPFYFLGDNNILLQQFQLKWGRGSRQCDRGTGRGSTVPGKLQHLQLQTRPTGKMLFSFTLIPLNVKEMTPAIMDAIVKTVLNWLNHFLPRWPVLIQCDRLLLSLT